MSQSNPDSECKKHLDLRAFLQHQKALRDVSPKILRKFIVSLNKRALMHMVTMWMKTMLNHHSFQFNQGRYVNNVDDIILNSMQNHFVKDYMENIEDDNGTKHHTILTMNPEALAYSMQFLTFREKCKLDIVCSHFVQINRRYNLLSNYYINIDRKLVINFKQNNINEDRLSHFKHISVEIAYNVNNVFDILLQSVVSNSINSLKTIEFKPTNERDCNVSDLPYSILQNILRKHKQLCIKKLIWREDGFAPKYYRDAATTIYAHSNIREVVKNATDDILNKIPDLLEFSCGLTKHCDYNGPRTVINGSVFSSALRVINHYKNLISLELHFPELDVFETFEFDIIALILESVQLKKLSIYSQIGLQNRTPQYTKYRTVHESLKEFHLKFNVIELRNMQTSGNLITALLFRAFSAFVEIETFAFGITTQTQVTQASFHMNIGVLWRYFYIQWQLVFGALFEAKRKHKSTPLKNITFDAVLEEDAHNVIAALTRLHCEKYLNLESLHINVAFFTGTKFKTGYIEFIDNVMVPFIHLYHVQNNGNGHKDCNLKRLSVSWGTRLPYSHKEVFELHPRNELICTQPEEFYYKPIMNLFKCIPKTLISLAIKPPFLTRISKTIASKNMQLDLAKQIVQFAVNKKDFKLQTIHLKNLKITPKVIEFWRFFFGYKRKAFVKKHEYCFNFIDD